MRLKTPFVLALAILAVAVLSIAGAFIFEALGYAPCELCLKERIPYYAASPLAGPYLPRAAVKPFCAQPSEALGAYHAGLEWGFWAGPQECSGALSRAASVGDFLAQLQRAKVVRCDAAALRLLGLSLAGWNAVVSAGLAGLAVAGLRLKP